MLGTGVSMFVYTCSDPWCVVCLGLIFYLFGLAGGDLWLRYFTLPGITGVDILWVPDILGFTLLGISLVQ